MSKAKESLLTCDWTLLEEVLLERPLTLADLRRAAEMVAALIKQKSQTSE